MKQQIVIRVQMNCDKCRSKAMKLVVSAGNGGVDSVKLDGKEKNQLVVTGEGVDPVCLVRVLRKKVGHSDLVGVEELKAKPKEPKVEPNVVQWYYRTPAPPLVVCDDPYYSSPSGCSIV